MSHTKFFLLLGVKALISIVLVWLILHRIPFSTVWEKLRQINPTLIAATLPLSLFVIFASALRWHALSLGLIPFFTAVRYTWIGMFYGAILPGGVSGDVAKGASLALRNNDVRVSRLPVSIFADRLMGLLALLIVFGLSCAGFALSESTQREDLRKFAWWGFGLSFAALSTSAALAADWGKRLSSAFIEILPKGRLQTTALSLRVAFFDLLSRPRLLLGTLFVSVLIHLANTAAYSILLGSLAVHLPIGQVVVFYTSLSVIVMLPISISGLGLRDWFSLAFFAGLGLPGATGVAFSWITLAVGTTVALIGGFIQLLEIFFNPNKPPVASSSSLP
jgi:uncharacterized protein (TIRG00374 family)